MEKMELKAGDKNSQIKLKQEAENSRLSRRKETIKKLLFYKRFSSAQQKEQSFHETMNAQEEPENKPEESMRPYGHRDLSKHFIS